MARRTMTFGVMPSKEEFDEACAAKDPDSGRSADEDGFSFGNDPRVGTVTMTPDELWKELLKARAEHDAVDGSSDDGGDPEKAGDWCSSVLGCLGFEWV